MHNDLSKIYDKLTLLDLDKLSKDEFKIIKKSLDELVNQHQSEMEELRTYFNSKLFIKADKDWVKTLINKLKKIMDRNEMQHKIHDEALISKKPFDNNKCGSCDVKLDHLQATRSD